MAHVYLSLGSNLGDRAASIQAALQKLPLYGLEVLTTARLYETQPWGVADQPRFLNSACIARITLPPLRVLQAAKAIERALGRTPTRRWGPRVIDIDLLLYDNVTTHSPELTLPHPGLLDRAYVLVPLAEIAPNVRHPITHQTVREHLQAMGPTPGVAPYPPGLASSEDSPPP
ncbi:MAG: 2-amino-4-hydroxy-6-hydroxymethyldihydropteridine diphosphokinase [Anaerolineae bacterium]